MVFKSESFIFLFLVKDFLSIYTHYTEGITIFGRKFIQICFQFRAKGVFLIMGTDDLCPSACLSYVYTGV